MQPKSKYKGNTPLEEKEESVLLLMFKLLNKGIMEQKIKNYIDMLQEVSDTLTAVPSDCGLDEAILRALRNLGEIKAYFKNSLN